MPGYIRLLTPLHEHHRARCALLLGALFSTYVFMPKKRVLDYSLDPDQPGEQFLFNLCIATVAIPSTSSPRSRARSGSCSRAACTRACPRRC